MADKSHFRHDLNEISRGKAGAVAQSGKPAVVVMARAPVSGRVKTRLCPPLDPDQAAEFYECLLWDVLRELMRSACWDLWVAYAENSRDYFSQWATHDMGLMPQRGSSLGERMHAVFVDLCRAGYRQVILVGSDIPALTVASIRRVCDVLELDQGDLALGPANDGGYYLIGLTSPEEKLFRGISWSTASVLSETLAVARQLELRVHMLDATYDVDIAGDMEHLRRDLMNSRSLRTSRPRTYAWMRRYFNA